MDEASKDELRALVVGFFIQSLKEHPDGLSIRDFERLFPERCDEERNWYIRYKKKTALEALQCIPDAVRVFQRNSGPYVTLNKQCNKVDNHLVDLVTHQRSTNKKRRNRAVSSFSLNRQYNSSQYSRSYSNRSRLNHGRHYGGENLFVPRESPSSFRPSIYQQNYNNHSSNMAFGDPRNRDSSSMVPPQVKISSYRSSISSASKPSPRKDVTPAKSAPLKTSSTPVTVPEKKKDDPETLQKKSYIRQKLVSLLTRKYAELKIIYLNSVYQLEYDEVLDPTTVGHSNMTDLLDDDQFKPYIQVNYKSPFNTIAARTRMTNGKENIDSSTGNKPPTSSSPSEKSNTTSSAKIKLAAVDLFNIRSMMKSLEPIASIKPPQLNNLAIDEAVKYKTLRIIFKSPNSTLKIDDWSERFEQESRLKIRIQDYGFRTLLEFFKSLAQELPIKVCLDGDDEWVAKADIDLLSEWMHKKLVKGEYRAITSIEAKYELIAFPDDVYTYTEAQEFINREFQPAFVLAIKSFNDMWIQLRIPKKIEEHLCIEASMTCYEDYKAQNLLAVPNYFVKPGFPCAVFDSKEQNRWCRALILKAPEPVTKNEFVTLLLVDYGFVRNYTISQLSCLMKNHLKMPVGPIYSRLYGIQEPKNSTDAQDKINKRAKRTLHEYTSPPVTLACKFMRAISTTGPKYLPKFCYEVALVDTRQGRDHNLADDVNLGDEI